MENSSEIVTKEDLDLVRELIDEVNKHVEKILAQYLKSVSDVNSSLHHLTHEIDTLNEKLTVIDRIWSRSHEIVKSAALSEKQNIDLLDKALNLNVSETESDLKLNGDPQDIKKLVSLLLERIKSLKLDK